MSCIHGQDRDCSSYNESIFCTADCSLSSCNEIRQCERNGNDTQLQDISRILKALPAQVEMLFEQ